LACHEGKEIAEEVGISEPQVSAIVNEFGNGNLAKNELAAADHATDWLSRINKDALKLPVSTS
jgi:hypothetical protein